ncbi:DGQHR domain-containing protein [Dickeya undicola]|uniref:DGQHR domain-containing protein n=1 Tax=Dickeya undicola TaxID=1577887 RepID=A0ABX9WQG3_9GAMM|nr:DGQHR domain-containing protein [Dickeya undicola]RNM20699.1 DGQHR domain-containing protein [Dickeya undicola]
MKESFSASLITQGNYKFYSLTLPIEIIANCCSPNPRSEDPREGFQRSLDESRADSIADYIFNGGVIPSSIILSAQESSDFEYNSKKKTLSFNNDIKSFLIIDGQHRAYGFRKLYERGFSDKKLRIPVVIFSELTPINEARLFIDVNTLQKPVPKELLLDIKKLAETENAEEEMLDLIFTLFEKNTTSSLAGKLSRFEKKRNLISKVTFYEAFKLILRAFDISSPQRLFEIINAYFFAAQDLLNAQGVNFDEIIVKPTSFKILVGHSKAVIAMIFDNSPESASLISEHKKYLKRSLNGNVSIVLNNRATVKAIELLDNKLLKRNIVI